MLRFWLFYTICATFIHHSQQSCESDLLEKPVALNEKIFIVPLRIAWGRTNGSLGCQYMYANSGTGVSNYLIPDEGLLKEVEPKFVYFTPFMDCKQTEIVMPYKIGSHWKLIPTTVENIFEIENVDTKQLLLVKDKDTFLPETFAYQGNRFVYTGNRNETASSTDIGALWQICSEDNIKYYVKNVGTQEYLQPGYLFTKTFGLFSIN